MYKHSTSINLTRAALNYLADTATELHLTNSSFSESLIMLHAFKNGYSPTTSELENFRCSFLVNSCSNLTGDFREQILTFEPLAQFYIICFFYQLNLVKGFRVSTRKMANLFKNDEICYFALGRIGRFNKFVSEYLQSFSLVVSTLGPTTGEDNEYLFFSNHQQFKVLKPYPLFASLLSLLNLPANTNVIKVHFTQLPIIANTIEQL